MTNPAMAPVISAVAAYKQKQLDRHLILKSMGRTPELHPKRCRVTDRLAIELADDLKAIGRLIIDMDFEDEPETVTGEPNTDSTIDPPEDDWIDWDCTQGGKPDLLELTPVEVKLRSGELPKLGPVFVSSWAWGELEFEPHNEIIAYRVVDEGSKNDR